MNIHPKFQCFVEDMAYLASRALYLNYNSFNINYVEAGSSWDFSPLAFVKERNELSFIEGTYDISINTQLLDRADLYDITFALFHEIRHIYQRQLIFEYLEYEPDELS